MLTNGSLKLRTPLRLFKKDLESVFWDFSPMEYILRGANKQECHKCCGEKVARAPPTPKVSHCQSDRFVGTQVPAGVK